MKKYLRKIYYSLPINLRFLIRRLFYFPVDLISKKEYNGIKLPPKGMIYTGGGDFLHQAKLHTNYLKEFAGLTPDSVVLDVGSGIGRSAIGLTEYLTDKGEYYGFDIVKKGVDWCQVNISNNYPNFHFKHIDLENDLYTNSGNKSTDFIFPYEDNKFDVVFLMSVFTHMQVEEIAHYLKEINRVLKKDGKCLATFFIYDDKIENKISNKSFRFSFPYNYNDYRLMNDNVKNANISLNKPYLDKISKDANLKIDNFIRGFWSEEIGIKNNDFQDIIIFKK